MLLAYTTILLLLDQKKTTEPCKYIVHMYTKALIGFQSLPVARGTQGSRWRRHLPTLLLKLPAGIPVREANDYREYAGE
jgi:hypothetical protein